MIILPSDLSINYAERLQVLIKEDEVLGGLDLGELLAVLAVTCFSIGVSRGVELGKGGCKQ